MKKYLTYILLVLFLTAWSQDSNHANKIEMEMLFYKGDRLNLHSMIAAENYLYFSRGIDPLYTSLELDKNLALAENFNTALEMYIRRHNINDYLKISGYWQNLRLKLSHTYRKGLARKLDERLKSMHGLVSRFNHDLLSEYQPDISANRLLVGKALYATHYLSFLFMAYRIEKDDYFKTLLPITMSDYKELIEKLKQTRFDSPEDQKRFEFVAGQMEKLLENIRKENENPENIVDLVRIIHNDIWDWYLR